MCIRDMGDDMFGGYFSNTEITDIDEKYIGSVLDLYSLTKVTRQLVLSMGEMMKLVCGFAILIFVILVYLLSKIIIEKNAQSISMTKILGYPRGEIARLYICLSLIHICNGNMSCTEWNYSELRTYGCCLYAEDFSRGWRTYL